MRDIGLKFCCRIWLGLCNLFQTFADLDDSVKDKETDIANIREIFEDLAEDDYLT